MQKIYYKNGHPENFSLIKNLNTFCNEQLNKTCKYNKNCEKYDEICKNYDKKIMTKNSIMYVSPYEKFINIISPYKMHNNY